MNNLFCRQGTFKKYSIIDTDENFEKYLNEKSMYYKYIEIEKILRTTYILSDHAYMEKKLKIIFHYNIL